MRRLFVVLAAVAGCAGGSATTSDSASTSVESVAETVAETEPPTTEPPETEPSATELPATIASTTSTTTAPTTTVLSLEQIAADIERDLNLGEQAWLAAMADPTSAELRGELLKYFSGNPLQVVVGFVGELEREGRVGRPNPEFPAVIELMGPVSVDDVAAPTHAEVRACRIDTVVIVQPAAGGDVVINDETARYVGTFELMLDEEIWKHVGGATDDTTLGAVACAE